MPDQPHIAYFTSSYPRASDSFIRNEIKALRDQGMQITTVAIRRPHRSQWVSEEIQAEGARTSYLLDSGVRLILSAAVRVLSHPRGFLRAARLLFATHPPGVANRFRQFIYLLESAALARLMAKLRIRHVHNHIGENSATVAMVAAEMSDLTFSITIHGPNIFFHPRQWAMAEKIHRSAFTACISRYCMSQCMIFADPEDWPKLRIVRCGINGAFLASTGEQPPPEQSRFVCVGRLCPEKGHLLLLEAVRRLRDEGRAIEMHLIGDGELRPRIEQFIRQHRLQSQIVLHGWATAEEIRQRLIEARGLVLPSFAEGLPVVFMESLAVSRPVIATQIAGIAELIVNHVNGWLIPPADVEALCNALREASDCTAEDIGSMGHAGRRLVERYHSSEREAAKLFQLFHSVLDEGELPVIADPKPVQLFSPVVSQAS